MADVPKEVEAIASQSWEMAQRVAMRITSLPVEERKAALEVAEQSLHETAKEMKLPADKIDGFIQIQMQAIGHFVSEIEVGGSPQGGNA